ncbi:MAG: replication initiation protein [Chloroflexi bacterium]|nr:replication initiation protein [Chloroflexota bacterium]
MRKDPAPATYHVAYTLEIPVARHNAAMLRPLAFYRDVYDGLAVRIGADCRYSGLMTKNPLHPPPGCSAQWFRQDPYTLTELREWLPLEIPKPVRETGVGRNEDLFRHCVKLAHQPRWARIIAAEGHAGRWLEHVRLLNLRDFAEDPLPDVECRSIAKSCAKYSLRNFSEERTSEIQRGRISKRWHGQREYDYLNRSETVGTMAGLGYRHAEIAAICGVTESTIRRDLAKYRRRRLESTDIRPGIPQQG